MRVSLLNCLYTRRKSTTSQRTLKQPMNRNRGMSQNSRPYHHPVLCAVCSLRTGVFGPCCSRVLYLQQQGQETLKKRGTVPSALLLHYTGWYSQVPRPQQRRLLPLDLSNKQSDKDISDRDFKQGDVKASVEEVAKGKVNYTA